MMNQLKLYFILLFLPFKTTRPNSEQETGNKGKSLVLFWLIRRTGRTDPVNKCAGRQVPTLPGRTVYTPRLPGRCGLGVTGKCSVFGVTSQVGFSLL